MVSVRYFLFFCFVAVDRLIVAGAAAAAAAECRSVLAVVVESVRATVIEVVVVVVESVGATAVVESGGTTVVEVGVAALDDVAVATLEGVVALDIDVVSLKGTSPSRSLYSSSELATPMRIEDGFARMDWWICWQQRIQSGVRSPGFPVGFLNLLQSFSTQYLLMSSWSLNTSS